MEKKAKSTRGKKSTTKASTKPRAKKAKEQAPVVTEAVNATEVKVETTEKAVEREQGYSLVTRRRISEAIAPEYRSRQGEYKLDQVVWEITLACCFSCKYCGSGVTGGKARPNELTTEECFGVADQLAGLDCRRVSLIGGEVFMRKDWKAIVSRLRSYGMLVNIITNGFVFKDAIIEDLKQLDLESVAVSLDGPKEVHDKYRQKGSYDRAIQAIEALTEAGIHTSVISTLNSENVKHLEEFYQTLTKYKIFAWQLQACSPMGNAANSGVAYAFSPTEVLNFVDTHADAAPFIIGAADNIGYYSPLEGRIRGIRTGYGIFGGCSAGISALGIDSVGNVRGCESMYDEQFNEGNLRNMSLRYIWENPDGFAYNRKFDPSQLTGRCAECSMGSVCAGGCRSYNHFTHGKLYEAPRCARYYD